MFVPVSGSVHAKLVQRPVHDCVHRDVLVQTRPGQFRQSWPRTQRRLYRPTDLPGVRRRELVKRQASRRWRRHLRHWADANKPGTRM